MMPKFRVYDKHLKILTDVSYIDFEGNELMFWLEDMQIVRDFDEVILMQSTGHKDKNGLEIFEGHIVKRTYLFNGGYGETHTGEVVYDKECAGYVISKPHQYLKLKTEELRNGLSDISTYEVIGNIWENPELGVACINTNRNFIGIELDDEYFEIAKKRIESHEVAE